nr:reverse transcriptase [Solanum melongena]WMB97016.1 reverse transcriptase [Solanum aethiopicum]
MPRSEFELIDLGSGFFLAKFSSYDDLQYAIEEGPWIIYGHYLTVRRWFPEFKPSETTIDSTAVWVRFPGLSIQYYNVTMIECYSQWEMPLVRPNKLIRIQALLLRAILPVFVLKFILINLCFLGFLAHGSRLISDGPFFLASATNCLWNWRLHLDKVFPALR